MTRAEWAARFALQRFFRTLDARAARCATVQAFVERTAIVACRRIL